MEHDDPRHGTYAGKQAHAKANEKPCDPCRIAYNAYQRERREAHPLARLRSQQVSRASSRAVWRLAARYATEYSALYADELGKQKAATQ